MDGASQPAHLPTGYQAETAAAASEPGAVVEKLRSSVRSFTARFPERSWVVRPKESKMTVIGFLSVAPVQEESMAGEVAKAVAALEEFEVSYETTPMGTTIEAPDSAELFAAAQAAHEAVDADRVSTVLKVDDKRTRETTAPAKVEAAEAELGRPARSTDDE